MSSKILESVNSSDFQELKSEILSKRSMGNVLFEIKHISSDINLEKAEYLTEIMDLFVSQMGCVGLGDRWKEIHQSEAEKISIFILKKDLAYSAKIMAIEEAEKFLLRYST